MAVGRHVVFLLNVLFVFLQVVLLFVTCVLFLLFFAWVMVLCVCYTSLVGSTVFPFLCFLFRLVVFVVGCVSFVCYCVVLCVVFLLQLSLFIC